MFYTAPSTAHGTGVFTDSKVFKGEKLFEMAVPPFLKAEEIVGDIKVMQIDHDLFSGESGGVEDFANHCCEPNMGFLDGTTVLIALRDIEPGEELFWDYSTSENDPGWVVPCGCGAENCRGEIRSFRDLDEAVQKRLLPYTLKYLREWYAKSMQGKSMQ